MKGRELKQKDYTVPVLKKRLSNAISPAVLEQVAKQVEELNSWSARDYQSTEDILTLKTLAGEFATKDPIEGNIYPSEEFYRFSWGRVVVTKY